MTLRSVARLLAAVAFVACTRGEVPSALVLHNGRIFAADTATPWAEAVLIRGDRIAAVGTNAEVLAEAPPNAVQVDLGGRADGSSATAAGGSPAWRTTAVASM